MTDGPQRIVVTSGSPSPEELAVVVVALASGGGDAPPADVVPPWRQAALYESVGARSVAGADDLVARHPAFDVGV